MYKFSGIFLVGWFLLFSSCSSNEGGKVKEELKKANAKDFSFSLLSVNAKEVSVEKIKSILKNPTGWTIKSLKIDNESFAEVTGTSVKDFKIKIKKAGEFSFSITLQKTGYEDFVLKGVKIKATFLADAKDFAFPLLELTGANEVTIEQIKKNLKSPAGWTIKTLKIDDESYAEVTGTNVKDFKIKIKKAGEFSFSVTLQKKGYEDFVLKGNIKAAKFTATASGFSFPELPVNVKEIPFATIENNLTKPAGWTIKSIAVVDSDFGTVSSQKIVLKKGGTFAINITLQKTGYEDFVLKGNIKAALFKADAKDFSFPELPVNAKEIPLDDIRRRVKKPAGWTIKSIKVADSDFGDVTGAGSSQKIVLKKGGAFVINITLQKTGFVDYVLKGNIKAALFKADAKDFSFPELSVNAKEIPFATIESNLKKPTGWTIKTIAVDNLAFGEVTGTGSSQKIVLKKGGTFVINITLQKTGWVDFVLKGNVKALNIPIASDFGFPELPVNAKEIPFATIERNLTKPTGWTIKSIAVADASFGTVTGAGSSQKIVLKKGGTFVINITLQKTGFADYVLKGNIKAANLKADPSKFSFPLLSVNAKEILIATIQSNLKKPTGWTIKSIAVADSSFGEVTGTGSSQKIVLKKPGTFAITITLQKTGWVDYTLSGSIKADHSVFYLTFDKASKTITGVKDKTITTLTIPNKIGGVAVEKIGKEAFLLSRLVSVTIPNSVTTIESNAFANCSSLTSITIPNSVTAIGDFAFFNCSSLTSVTIPNSVTTIGSQSFANCSSLTSVTIPSLVTTIGQFAFYNCYSLTSVTIGNSVTTIARGAFFKCSSLSSVTIPSSVTTIGNGAFYECSKLEVTVTQTDPSKITLERNIVFGDISKPKTLVKQIKVPTASLAAYKAAGGWSTYAGIMTGY